MEPDSRSDPLHRVLSSKSKWDAATTRDFLEGTRLPLRLASLNRAGFPQITSLWFGYADGVLLCCTQKSALACRQIERDPRCGFEVAVNEPPYYGVSGQGEARIRDDDPTAVLRGLIDRYLEGRDRALGDWLLSRTDSEVIIEITPTRLTTWDFRKRMSAPD